MIRTFLAISLPESYHGPLAEVLRVLQQSRADVKWVPVGNIHLTLKFFGNLTAEQVEAVIAALTPVAAATGSFSLAVTQLGGFPSLQSPRVIWLGCGGQLDRLQALYEAVNRALLPLGFTPEERAFTPHLTLGRVRSGQGRAELRQALQKVQVPPLPAFQVREIVLYQSILKPQGAVYLPLARLAFRLEG